MENFISYGPKEAIDYEYTSSLLHDIQAGEVVLVLGAGASLGASSPSGANAPTSKELTRKIADRFLDGEHADDSLAIVAELAVSETGLFPVQEFIRNIFQEIRPAQFHLLLPTFKWAGIATTNFDLVIERGLRTVQRQVTKSGSSNKKWRYGRGKAQVTQKFNVSETTWMHYSDLRRLSAINPQC